jgi:hypothetical protein
MSDFLSGLVERTQGVAPVAQPIIPPMFAPVSTTLSEYSENPRLDSEPLNDLNRAMVTHPPNDSSSAMLNHSFRKKSNTRFAPPRHIESDLSEHVEAVLPQPINGPIVHDTIKHSSSSISPKDLTTSKRQKGNFSGNTESQLPEQSLGAKRSVSGRLIDSDQLIVPQSLPDAELNQNIGTQLNKRLLNEKRDASGGLIKLENVSMLQEMAEAEGDLVNGLQPEHSPDQASALLKVAESAEVQSAETSYLKPHSFGKIRFQQPTEMEPSPESTIKVTIGRVEVRAIMPSEPIATASHAHTRSPTLSLDDYLKRRNEGQL